MCNLALISAKRKPFRVAKAYTVTRADRERYASRYWRLPTRLVRDGDLAGLWQLGEAVPSVLAVLAVHAHPEPGAEWSHPIDLEHERIARLSRAHRVTVVSAIAALCDAGYLRQEIRAHPTERQWTLRRFYLAASLYARDGEPYVSVDGSFIYDKWRWMPSHAVRHLHLVRAALSPVRNVAAYTAAVPGDTEGAAELVREHIEAHAPSPSALSRSSGISRRAIGRIVREEERHEEGLAYMNFIATEAEGRRHADLDFYFEEADREESERLAQSQNNPSLSAAPASRAMQDGLSATTVVKRGGLSATGINPFTTQLQLPTRAHRFAMPRARTTGRLFREQRTHPLSHHRRSPKAPFTHRAPSTKRPTIRPAASVRLARLMV